MRSHTHNGQILKYSEFNHEWKETPSFLSSLICCLELTGWSRVYNTDSSVNLQVVLVSLEVNRIADPQEDKDFLEVGYSYQFSPGWKQGLQRRLFCRPPRWINLPLKLNVDLQGVLVSESSWTSSRLIPTEEQSMVSCATTCVNKGRVHKKSERLG